MTNTLSAVARGRWCVVLATLAAACSAPPASPEMTAQAERRLLAPFLRKQVVVCDELVVDMTANFDNCVTSPGVDRELHRFDVQRSGGATEMVWTNISGLEAGWFTIAIREAPAPDDVSGKSGPHTVYKVLNRFVRRIRGGELGLTASATGGEVMLVEDGGPVQRRREFTIANGGVQQ